MKKEKKTETSLVMPVTSEFVERRIHIIRNTKVIIDSDLAELYQVTAKRLNEQVKRNSERFPSDFMFQLNQDEVKVLRSQFATLKKGKHRKYLPYAFTELGVAMLSSVLKSDRAVQMNIYIMRAFVKLREIMASNAEIGEKIKELEKGQKKNTEHIIAVASTLKRMMSQKTPVIGFVVDTDKI